MTLRTDIHTAFDVITPATGGMPERVVESVRREAPDQRRRRVMVRVRAPLALVAVFIAVALVAAAVIGTQAIRAWNAQHTSSPAGTLSAVAELESRPLTLPNLQANDTCPQHPGTNALGFDYGDGPVYAMGGGYWNNTKWGNYWSVEYFIGPSVHGPILIRGRDLHSNNILVFVGNHATGPVVGTDQLGSQAWEQRSELVLDRSDKSDIASSGLPGWQVVQGLFAGWTGCFGVQIDGAGFSETVITIA